MPMMLVNVDERTGFQMWRNVDENHQPIQQLGKKKERERIKKMLEEDDEMLPEEFILNFANPSFKDKAESCIHSYIRKKKKAAVSKLVGRKYFALKNARGNQ